MSLHELCIEVFMGCLPHAFPTQNGLKQRCFIAITFSNLL